MDELLELVTGAIRTLNAWMRRHVRGFEGFGEDDVRSHAAWLAYSLQTGTCTCGEADCTARHRCSAFESSGLTSFGHFIRCAVIGPRGLRANSLAQGMLYRVILRRPEDVTSESMMIALVELKHCSCKRSYEMLTCPTCNRDFDPHAMEAIGQPRLILSDRYLRVRRWSCAGTLPNAAKKVRKKPRKHYFRQGNCRESLEGTVPCVSHHVHHGSPHDGCPLNHCSRCGQRHPRRGTSLWVRRELGEGPETRTPVGWLIIERWARRTLRAMPSARRVAIRRAVRERVEVARGRRPGWLMIARWLLTEVRDGIWSAADRARALEEVRELLRQRGLDIEMDDCL